MYLEIILFTYFMLTGVKKYYRSSYGKCRSNKKLTGKTVIVTGANSGLGKATAMDLALRGARVILACRNLEAANATKEEIIYQTDNENIVVHHVDFESLDSVREFSKKIHATEERVDILINNAGASQLGNKLTKDGLHIAMQVNHFAPFLLTNLLLASTKMLYKSTRCTTTGTIPEKIYVLACNRLGDGDESIRSVAKELGMCYMILTSYVKKYKETGSLRMDYYPYNEMFTVEKDKKLIGQEIDLLKKSAPSRIVNVSSRFHKNARLNLNDLNEAPAVDVITYSNTKLCNLLMSNVLSRRLAGTGVTSNCSHPGFVDTNICKNMSYIEWLAWKTLAYLFFRTPKEGAQTTIHLAVSEELENVSGKYFANCVQTNPSKQAQDNKLADQVWELSEKAVGLMPDETHV